MKHKKRPNNKKTKCEATAVVVFDNQSLSPPVVQLYTPPLYTHAHTQRLLSLSLEEETSKTDTRLSSESSLSQKIQSTGQAHTQCVWQKIFGAQAVGMCVT